MYAQSSKSDRRGIPVDSLVSGNSISAITGETAQFYYNNAGTLTADAGQAAATIVVAKLAYNHILNKIGGNIGVYGDTSLSFTSTAFTTEINLGPTGMEAFDAMTEVERLVFLAGIPNTAPSPFTADGQYFVDYNRGYLYGRKASTQSTLTSVAYSCPSSTTSGTITGSVAVTSVIPGTGATNLGKAEDAVHASADVGVMSLAVANEAQSNLSSTDGDYTPIGVNRKGTVYTAETLAPVYENNTTGKAVVEENYTNATVTADGQVKGSAGFIRSVTFSATGTVTAGLITIYDNTAESGTVIWSGIVQVTTAPVTIFLGVPTATGIYVGYDGTIANVRTQVSYR